MPHTLGNQSNPGVQVADASLPYLWLHAQLSTGSPSAHPAAGLEPQTFSQMSQKGLGDQAGLRTGEGATGAVG